MRAPSFGAVILSAGVFCGLFRFGGLCCFAAPKEVQNVSYNVGRGGFFLSFLPRPRVQKFKFLCRQFVEDGAGRRERQRKNHSFQTSLRRAALFWQDKYKFKISIVEILDGELLPQPP